MNTQRLSFPADATPLESGRRWLWLLFGGPAIVVVASLFTAWIAAHTSDGVVDESYYQHGLMINRKLAASPPPAMPQGATIAADARGVVVTIVDAPAPARALTLVVVEPHAAGTRRTEIALAPQPDGRWMSPTPLGDAGRKVLTLVSDAWQFPVTTVDGPVGTQRLGPAGRKL
ncbi:MAG: FixH family protein [Proteobacteria bacterium]|nr:FixH family protein [Pseudomonadota bacterium]